MIRKAIRQRDSKGMQDLDRVGWADSLALDCYGLRIGIRVRPLDLLERVIQECLPPDWKRSRTTLVDRLFSFQATEPAEAGNQVAYRLHDGPRPLLETNDLERALTRLESGIRWYVAENARNRVFMHAGAVGWKGKAIVLPGESYTGKTNLVAALIRAGATYYSDECTVFDDRGWVHPYRKPLAVRRDGQHESDRIDPKELGAEVGTEPIPTGLVVLAKYEQGAVWEPERVRPGLGVQEMLSQAAPAIANPEGTMAVLDRVVRDAPVVRGLRGEADEMAAQLLATLEASASLRVRPNFPVKTETETEIERVHRVDGKSQGSVRHWSPGRVRAPANAG